MLTIGIIEDESLVYKLWEREAKEHEDCQTIWMQQFDECYDRLNEIDVLIADRCIEIGGIEHDLIYDGHIQKISESFAPRPIYLCSRAGTPPEERHHFRKIVPSKTPEKIRKLFNEILLAWRQGSQLP